MASEQVSDRRRLMRTIPQGLPSVVVLHHQMQRPLGRHAGVDGAQDLHKLTASVASMQLTDYLTGLNVERRKQCGGAVAHVVVSTTLRNAACQWQHGLCAVQCLGLALFVHVQHHRPEWWVQPDSRHRGLRELRLSSRCARTPVRRSREYALKRLRDNGIHTHIVDRSGCALTRRIEQTIQPISHEARTPLRYGLLCDPQFRRDALVVDAIDTRQHDSGSQRRRLRRLGAHRQCLELLARKKPEGDLADPDVARVPELLRTVCVKPVRCSTRATIETLFPFFD